MKRKWFIVWLCCWTLTACDGADRALPVSVGSMVSDAETALDSRTLTQELLQQPEEGSGEVSGEICVYVCGAVDCPGIVKLPQGARAYEALEAAGGFTGEAAQDVVNLAGFLQDGEQLYFPTKEEAVEIRAQAEAEQSGLVNINTADASSLCTLPGIGESRAADIIAYREANGGFRNPEDIMQVPGIKEGAYAKIKDRITVR